VGAASVGVDTKRMSVSPKQAVVGVGWLPKGTTSYPLFKAVIEKATDFSWLSKGQSVLVKLALNSGFPNPKTTDPWALDCLLQILQERGAGKIYVGDQAGARHVFWTAQGQQRGSTRAFFQQSGLLPVVEKHGAVPVCFEECGYDAYIAASPAGEHHWTEPMHIPSLIREVDHIVYLPRLGSHILADFTCGIKIAVGFLREDSRRLLHQGGANFYAMYQEISEVPEIKSKLRLCVCSGRSVLSLMGPDAGYVVEPESGPVFASENLLAHDLFAYAFLQYVREGLTPEDATDAAILKNLPVPAKNLWDVKQHAATINRGFLKLVWNVPSDQIPELPVFQSGDIYAHPAIVNYLKLNPEQDSRFSVAEVNENVDLQAKRYMESKIKV